MRQNQKQEFNLEDQNKYSMNVGIDARTLSTEGGSKTYAVNLIKELYDINEISLYLFGDKNSDFGNIPCFHPWPRSDILRPFWENISIAPYTRNVDLVHGLKNVAPTTIGCETVVTIHDVFRVPNSILQQTYWELFLPIFIRRASIIITPSEFTKKEIISKYGTDSNSIRVIPHGYNRELYHDQIGFRRRF